ncbi:MAG: sugar-binding protein, partial [Candidatus Hinthialibacter sp.]
PPAEGSWGLYVDYDATTGNYWAQASLTLPEPKDLTGVTELRFSMYFLEDSSTNGNGVVPVRMHLNPDDCLSFDYITPGEWYEVVMPIDPYRSANEMTSFGTIKMVLSAGLVGSGSFFIDNIYGVRPTDPVELEFVTVYGLNETNPGEDTPLGWTQDGSELPPVLGAEYVTPSEGDNCMLIPVTANNVRAVKTLNTLEDVDWTRVRAVYLDACVTDDFSTWLVIRPYLESASGGTVVPVEFRGISGNKADWRTIGFSLDIGAHMSSIIKGEEFAIGFHHDNGGDSNTPDGQHVLIDNIRFGLVSSFCLAVRSFEEGVTIYQGDSASFGVSIEATMKGEAGAVVITETLPQGWTAENISQDGVLSDGVITWNIDASADEPVTLTYTAVSQEPINELPVWSGTANGEDLFGQESPLFFSEYVKASLVEAPLLSNAVQLDGVISDGEYNEANVYSFNHDTSDGNTAPGVHISGNEYAADVENAVFHIFHDSDYIYVAVDVTDPDLNFEYPDMSFWNADSVEIYLDGNMSRSSSIESTRYGCQLTVVGDGRIAASNNKYFPEMLDAASGGKYMEDGRDGEDQPVYWACGAKVKEDGSGFIVEYRIIKDVILDPAGRTQIGFDIMMN